jgi:EF-P beta-lysylation protein EpmB
MITRSMRQIQQPDWIEEIRHAFVDPLHLLENLGLTAVDVDLASNANKFPFRVPRPFAARMRLCDPFDPLLLQVLPRTQEFSETPGYGIDPVGDLTSRVTPSLLQKYRGRVLLIMSGGCAINCRYCFRRHFPYGESVGTAQIERALAEVRDDCSISEIILSGGDPLLLKDDYLGEIIEQLAAIPQLRRLRVHTRLPVTIPSRITEPLLRALTDTRLTPVVVMHINHPNEIDAELGAALARCSSAGIQLLNQSVLLRGINDDAVTLAKLSETLFAVSVLPYYVHLLDPVAGAAHFDVDEATAVSIAAAMRDRLPGYLVPRFVREITGENAKTPIA